MGLEILEKINDIPEGLSLTDKFLKSNYNIAKVITNGHTGYVKLDDNNKKEIISKNMKTRFEPIIPYKNIERWNCMIYGASGKGKTVIAGEFAKQFHHLTGGNVYYICSTPIQDDRTFSQLTDFVKQMDVHQFYNDKMTKDEQREMIKGLFSNSLTIFDDNDMATDAKAITAFRNIIIEVGRKYGANTLFISHKNCDGNNTKMLLKELHLYICFKNGLSANRLLTEYYSFDKDYLKDIKKNTKSWVCFNFQYDKVITPWIIKNFDIDKDDEKDDEKGE